MASWREYARKVDDEPSEGSADQDRGQALGANGAKGTALLPPAIAEGLAILTAAPAPRMRNPILWPQIVADAERLAADGWAQSALALGWTALDLFGAVIAPAGDPNSDGLAVKLEGRRVLAICASFATVSEGVGRAYLYRPTQEPTGRCLLWDIGK